MIMAADSIEEIRSQMREARATVRFRAISEIAKKSGNGIEIKLDQPEVIPILLDALSDKDRRVQRAAARALRPFLKKYPELIDTALPIYATDQFDGSFTHAGLLDIRDQTVWVPRFQATKGHAALLKDGNTDRFFKFEFFLPNQAPRRLVTREGSESAHLLMHLILDWSYSRRVLIPEWDDRRLVANRREQQLYVSAVVRFYDSCHLSNDLMIHYLLMQAGKSNVYEIGVTRIEGRGA